MIDDDLTSVRNWANDKLQSGTEPPWAQPHYLKLVEAVDAIAAGRTAVSRTVSSQQLDPSPEMRLRLVDSTYLQDNAQRRPSDEPVQMPM